MREYEDALRSVRRYVFNALGGKPWRVRHEMDARFKRPFALVNTPSPSDHRRSGPSAVQQTLPITVQLYPAQPSTADYGTNLVTEARMRAARAAELLTRAITIGIQDINDPSVYGYPQRIPLWDYHDANGDPLPYDEKASIATERAANDYLMVGDDFTVHVQAEASEGQLFVAIGSFSVSWYRPTLVRPQGQLLTGLDVPLQT